MSTQSSGVSEAGELLIDPTREAFEAGLLAGPTLTFMGEHYTVDGIAGFPVPVQRPHPPILAGSYRRANDTLGIAVAGLGPGQMAPLVQYSDEFGSSVERAAKLNPLWQSLR
jgi:alkanesulfonate monooxygenase SsuD/methylene tetrahydromethanopterin reductase-like flavin-dependent oxidoreductase (luciferase family)